MSYDDHYDRIIKAIREFIDWCEKYHDMLDADTKGFYRALKMALKRYIKAKRERA